MQLAGGKLDLSSEEVMNQVLNIATLVASMLDRTALRQPNLKLAKEMHSNASSILKSLTEELNANMTFKKERVETLLDLVSTISPDFAEHPISEND